MRRKTMRHKMMELSRQLYFQRKGTYNGFGKSARHYGRNWRINFPLTDQNLNSYKDVWNCELMMMLRKAVEEGKGILK